VGGVYCLPPVDPIYAEGLDRRLGMFGQILDGHSCGVSAQDLLAGHLRPPDSAPAGALRSPPALVHLLDPSIVWDLRPAVKVEGVLHLPGGMILGLEEGIEVPEAGLYDLALNLHKAHLQHDLTHEIDEPLVGVLLARVDLVCGQGDVVGSDARFTAFILAK